MRRLPAGTEAEGIELFIEADEDHVAGGRETAGGCGGLCMYMKGK